MTRTSITGAAEKLPAREAQKDSKLTDALLATENSPTLDNLRNWFMRERQKCLVFFHSCERKF